jgi:hypothetical protein
MAKNATVYLTEVIFRYIPVGGLAEKAAKGGQEGVK